MGVRWFWAHTQGDTHRKADTWLTARCSDPGRNPHRWPGVPKTRTRTHGETHIEESTKGGGRRRRPPPPCGGGAKRRLLFMGLSMGTGSCLWDARPAMYCFTHGFLHGSEHRALNHLSAFLWVSPGSEPCTIELPLGTIASQYPLTHMDRVV